MAPDNPTFQIPDELPVIPLREFVMFPYMVLPVFVARDESLRAVEHALENDRLLMLVAQRDAEMESPEPEDLYQVGTAAMIMRVLRLPDGRVKVLVQGLARAEIQSFVEEGPVRRARISPCIEQSVPGAEGGCVEVEALMRSVRSRIEEILPYRNLPPEVFSVTSSTQDPGRLADLVASNLQMEVKEAQGVLESLDPIARLRRADAFLRRELDVTTVQAEIHSQAKEGMARSQREHFLREQMRAIQAELGEDSRGEETDDYRVRVDEAGLPPEAMAEAQRQLRRLERMHPDGPEAQVVRTFMDWILDLPWSRSSPDELDLEVARSILDRDHAHLDRVKDRILEFLGVRKLRGDSRGPILCFVGPPGVGKTSLGRSIARAMGREFVRISLGGVRDEAEIRGHRRTYVGALPGRIVQGLKQAGTNNPVFMLDEIDKIGADFRGDPASALLEVLDPEQNNRFSDHYLNVPFDLSSAFFITTANLMDPIPAPLRDRMEVIRLAGYTPEEKTEIANSYLIPKQMEEHGLPGDRIRWSDSAVKRVVSEYTSEAGVRNLERQIATICRKVARRAAEGDENALQLAGRGVPRWLGPPTFIAQGVEEQGQIGVVNGLAWTESGGDVLSIEAVMTRGQGLVLTGHLGEVMKESGRAALTYARWCVPDLGVDEKLLSRRQVHVHIPAGAIPKDGPSAGITIATAILSLATGIPVRSDVAMTGEVTLRGRVLPIGGVREKSLAAHRNGIRTIILPRKNMDDLEDIPAEVKRKITFVPVSHMDEVLEHALESVPAGLQSGSEKALGAVGESANTPAHARRS